MGDVFKPCIQIGDLADRPANPTDKADIYIARDQNPPQIFTCDDNFNWIQAGGGGLDKLFLHQTYFYNHRGISNG